MKWRWFGPGVAGVGDGMAGRLRPRPGLSDSLSVGQREEDLVARKGQPQEIQPEPGGGKTYVYTTSNIDQMATMGGGAWDKPDQVYCHIHDQGVIIEVKH